MSVETGDCLYKHPQINSSKQHLSIGDTINRTYVFLTYTKYAIMYAHFQIQNEWNSDWTV